MCDFRKLKANELQCRLTDTKIKGSATILIYKDARVDMKILDESVGLMNWCKDYKSLDGKIYCGVGIYNEKTNQYIFKWDCGSDNNNGIEAEKSEASDAFKRACSNWGIGRELYNLPRIKIQCPDKYYYNEKLCMSFSVKEIIWENDNLKSLIIIDKFGNVVYNFNEKSSNPIKNDSNNNVVLNNFEKIVKNNVVINNNNDKKKSIDNASILKSFCSSLKGKVDTEKLKEFYNYWNGRIEKGEFKGTISPEALWKRKYGEI